MAVVDKQDQFFTLRPSGSNEAKQGDAGQASDLRNPACDAVVQMLRDRELADRAAREKRQRWYKQSLESGSGVGSGVSSPAIPSRLCKFGTKVPCRVTPEARATLDELEKRFPGATVTFRHETSGRQAVMLTQRAGTEASQIGWVEHRVQADPACCNVRDQGLTVETDADGMLVLCFRYPSTAVRMFSKDTYDGVDDVARVDFTEIRPALDLRESDNSSSPRLVWVTRPEAETINALQSRDYEAFYVRFKLEVQAGIWSSLSSVFSSLPASEWHQDACYTLVRRRDATIRRIYQTTVDDTGRPADIGSDRIYDAAPATDILLLFLEGDILAEFANIYFALQSLKAANACVLKEEFFTLIRRFWANAQSLASCYGSDLAAIVRMAQSAVPMPAQAPLLKQDWTNLRQALVDRYGEGGRKADELAGQRPRRRRVGPVAWPFMSFPFGDVNVGLRVVYRQEWRCLGAQRGEVVAEIAAGVAKATVDAMKWPVDAEGRIQMGARSLAAKTDMGLESECLQSSRETSARLTDIASRLGASVYPRLQQQHDVLTRTVELQNIVLIAEKLPTPAEIDLAWVRRHDWILAKVLLDESFRDSLVGIHDDARDAKRSRLYEHLRANILHYQRAIWQQEDPQQRSMRYRKSGATVPLEWRFELESGGALSIEALGRRLAATHVAGQFATYSAGKKACLDQVIDPAGPIGYYGNYAIYYMRPEFGSDDLFSMLHFFKSPYLRQNPETGEVEVDDPAQSRLSEDVVSRGRALPSAPDTENVVTDALRNLREPQAGWTIHPRDDGLLAGAPEEKPMILTRDDGGIELTAIRDSGSADEGEMLLRSVEERALVVCAAPSCERAIVAPDEGAMSLTASAGARPTHAHERFILANDDEWLRPSLIAE